MRFDEMRFDEMRFDEMRFDEMQFDEMRFGFPSDPDFQDTPILNGGVGIYESFGNVVVLVATVSSVHKMVFRHPGEKAWLYRMGNLRAT
jgi:hypothetical protein